MRVDLLAATACCHVGYTRAFSPLNIKPIKRPDVASDTKCTSLQMQPSQDANHPSIDNTNASLRAVVSNSRPEDDTIAYPVTVRHQGHVATIHVRENEPILHALERQSITTSLGLSNIPHQCRRGNCLTCAAHLTSSEEEEEDEEESTNYNNNIQANVNTGLTPSIDRELTSNNYILTCCSYITGPGITLELEQNEIVWDRVYRERVVENMGVLGMEMRAKQKRGVDERDVGRWRKRMEKLFDD